MDSSKNLYEPFIDTLAQYLIRSGVRENDHALLREIAQDIAVLTNAISPSQASSLAHAFRADSASRETRYTHKEITDFNRAAETYFQRVARDNLPFLLNKPLSGIFYPPILLYRFSVLLASLDLGLHTVLDFGAGSCWVSSMLNRMGCRTIAVDVSETALRCGRHMFELDKRHRMELDPQFVVYDGYTLPLRDQTVDRIICFDAMHHVPNKQDILNEMSRVLKWGGKVGFSEPGVEHAHSSEAIHDMEMYQVLESDIDLLEFLGMAEHAGFDGVSIKPYPSPERISFNAEEYQRFLSGENQVFPLDMIRDDLKHSTNIILHKGAAAPDSRKPHVLRAGLKIMDHNAAAIQPVQRGQVCTFQIEVENIGNTIWLAKSTSLGGFVAVGAHLYREGHTALAWDCARGYLSREVHPGEKQIVEVVLAAPQEPGSYIVEFDLVCEMISWFAAQGSKTLRCRIEVV